MTFTDAAVGAAALWLLLTMSGLTGARPERAAPADGRTVLPSVAADARPAALPYSVWHEDISPPRHVTPPLPGASAATPDVTYNALGSTAIHAIWQPQVLSLTEVTIAPGGELTLNDLDGSGVMVLRSGWLELTAQDGDTRLIRAPQVDAPPPAEDETLPVLAPGDRLTFGPGATLIFRNRGDLPAQLITASVLVTPGQAA